MGNHAPGTSLGFSGGTGVKNMPVNAGDARAVGSIPGSGRSSGEGDSNPLQHSCLWNPMDRGAWWARVHEVTKRRTQLRGWACSRLCTEQNLLLYWPPIAMNRPVEDLKLFCFFLTVWSRALLLFFLINLNFFLKSLLNLLHYFFCIIFSGFFWPWCMWYLSSPVKDRTHTPCVRRQILNHRLPGRTPGHFLGRLSSSSLETQSALWESICPD